VSEAVKDEAPHPLLKFRLRFRMAWCDGAVVGPGSKLQPAASKCMHA
jgi:hypothetical protein